jgi:hypothetical protein
LEYCLIGDQQVEDAPDGEHIAGRLVFLILLGLDDLRRNKPWRSTSEKQVRHMLRIRCQSKVNNHCLILLLAMRT